MSRDIKERTILDTFAEDFVEVVEKHAKYVIVSGKIRKLKNLDLSFHV